MKRASDRLVAAVESDQAFVLDARRAVDDLAVMQLRLCYRAVSSEDIEEMAAIIGRIERGLMVERRWLEWIRNGRHIYNGSSDVVAPGSECAEPGDPDTAFLADVWRIATGDAGGAARAG